jgi:hypothetical protein
MNKYFYTINDLLGKFEPVSLAEMDCVKLMDRTDVKFILSFSKLEPVLRALSDHYNVLTINGLKVFNYRTDYFDTSNLDMFFDHHNGKLNRFKIRQREYLESNLSFLEVKFKSNKGRVIKDRIERSYSDQNAFSGFINKHTPYNPEDLSLTIINRFNRFTLVDKCMRERVTIDFNLAFADNMHDLLLHGLVIIEVKQNKTDKQSEIFNVLKSNVIRPASISKYCLGMSMLNQNTKINNFKKTILVINKLSHVELSA